MDPETLWTPLLLWVTFFWASTAHAGDELKCIQEFDDLRTEIEGRLKPGDFKSCQPTSAVAGDLCSTRELCKTLGAHSQSGALYSNSKGDVIPDFRLFAAEEKLNNCYNALVEGENSNRFEENAEQHRSLAQLRESRKLLSTLGTARSAFSKAVSDGKLQETQSQLELAQRSITPLVLFKGKSTQEKAGNWLTALELKAKVKFPDAVRDLFIKYRVAEQDEMASRLVNRSFGSPFGSFDELEPEVPVFLEGWKRVHQNPFLNPAAFYDEGVAGKGGQLAKNQAAYTEKVRRAEKIFETSKKHIIGLLEKRSVPKGQEPAIANMIKRIQATQFKVLSLDRSLHTGSCSSPNAYFQKQSVTLCPQILQYPEISLASIIGHEIGHAIDPCSMTMALSDLPEKGERIEPVEFKSNPFSSVVGCLETPQSIGARVASTRDFEKALKEHIYALHAQGYDETTSTEFAQSIRSLASIRAQGEKQFCDDTLSDDYGRPQMKEAFADWVATEVVVHLLTNLEENKGSVPEVREAAIEAVGSKVDMFCILPGSLAIVAKIEKAVQKACGPSAVGSSTLSTDEHIKWVLAQNRAGAHPSSPLRVEKILLAQPQVRKALGCPGKGGATYCE